MKAQFVLLNWKKGTSHLVQGIKGNNRPKKALAGGNGSFIVSDGPAQLILFVKTIDNQIIQKNILPDILEHTNRSRMSENLFEKIETICENTTFNVSKTYDIDISPIIKQL